MRDILPLDFGSQNNKSTIMVQQSVRLGVKFLLAVAAFTQTIGGEALQNLQSSTFKPAFGYLNLKGGVFGASATPPVDAWNSSAMVSKIKTFIGINQRAGAGNIGFEEPQFPIDPNYSWNNTEKDGWQNRFLIEYSLPKNYSKIRLWGNSPEWKKDLSNSSDHMVCKCRGPVKIYAGGLCFSSLEKAIKSSPSNFTESNTFFIGSDLTITGEIEISQNSLNLYGVDCRAPFGNSPENVRRFRKPIITSAVCGVENERGIPIDDVAMFVFKPEASEGRTNFKLDDTFEQQLNLRDLEITQINNTADLRECFGHVAYVPKYLKTNLWISIHYSSINIRNCKFTSFMSRSPGALFQLSGVSHMLMDDNTVVRGNQVKGYKPNVYAGGMVYIENIHKEFKGTAYFGGLWINNKVAFPNIWNELEKKVILEGSMHAEGGCIFVSTNENIIVLNGTFVNNNANEAGVFKINSFEKGLAYVDGWYESNKARDDGAGGRGGCFRIFDMKGKFKIRGTYIDNWSSYEGPSREFSGRGAVVALNYLSDHNDAVIDIGGTFKRNVVKDWGSILSLQGYKTQTDGLQGKVIIRGDSIFEDNVAENNHNVDLVWINHGPSISNEGWNGNDFQWNGY